MPRMFAMLMIPMLLGWVKPYHPDDKVPAGDPKLQLKFVTVKVDGQRTVVEPDQELSIIYGSELIVEDAVLNDVTLHPERVNVIGFTHHGWPSDEDRSRVVKTDSALKQDWSEANGGRLYAITVSSKDVLHGTVYFRLLAPELRFAEILVNGDKQIMRDGDLLTLKSSDKIKVLRVETNIKDPKNVLFQIMELTESESQANPLRVETSQNTHEIRFKQGEMVFARIPLKVVE